MILLTRLDNTKLLVSLEAVKYVESTPDTLITFLNGDSLMVRESLSEVDQAAVASKARVLRLASAPSEPLPTSATMVEAPLP